MPITYRYLGPRGGGGVVRRGAPRVAWYRCPVARHRRAYL